MPAWATVATTRLTDCAPASASRTRCVSTCSAKIVDGRCDVWGNRQELPPHRFHIWTIKDASNAFKMKQFNLQWVHRIFQLLTFAQPQFLIRNERDALRLLLFYLLGVRQEFGFDFAVVLFAARKVDSHAPWLARIPAARILASVFSSKRMDRINGFKPFMMKNLRGEPF